MVDIALRFPALIVVHRRPTVPLGECLRALVGSVGDDRDTHSFAKQALESELGDIAGAEYHCPPSGQSAKDLFGELNRRRADRRCAASDACLELLRENSQRERESTRSGTRPGGSNSTSRRS